MEWKVIKNNPLLDQIFKVNFLGQNWVNDINPFPWVEHVEWVFKFFFKSSFHLKVWVQMIKVGSHTMFVCKFINKGRRHSNGGEHLAMERIFFKIEIKVFHSLYHWLWRILLHNIELLSVIKHCPFMSPYGNLPQLLRNYLGASLWCDYHVVSLKSFQLGNRLMDYYVVWKVIDWLNMLYLTRQIVTFVSCFQVP